MVIDRATPPRQPLTADEIVQEHGQDDVLVDETPLLIDDPEPVAVGVRGQPEMAFLVATTWALSSARFSSVQDGLTPPK